MSEATRYPYLGAGIGLRREYFEDLVVTERPLDWLEVVSENVLGVGGRSRWALEACRERWTIVPHGVNLNIGGPDPLDTPADSLADSSEMSLSDMSLRHRTNDRAQASKSIRRPPDAQLSIHRPGRRAHRSSQNAYSPSMLVIIELAAPICMPLRSSCGVYVVHRPPIE